MEPPTPQSLLKELQNKVKGQSNDTPVTISAGHIRFAIHIIEEWNRQNESIQGLMGDTLHHG